MKQMRGASREGSPPLAFLPPNRMVHLWWSHSGGSRPRHPTCGGLPVAGEKHPHAVCFRTDCFCLGKFFCSHWRGGAGESSCQSLQGSLESRPVRQTGEGRLEIFLRGRYAGSRRRMSARLRCSANFFRTACEKKPSRVDVKTYFMTPGFLARAGRGFCLPKRENQQ